MKPSRRKAGTGTVSPLYPNGDAHKLFDLKTNLQSEESSATGYGPAPPSNVDGDIIRAKKVS